MNEPSRRPILGLVHISGARHGTTEMLLDDELVIGTARDADIHVPYDREPEVAGHHARLERHGATYRLRVEPGATVRVNGERVDELVLASGDVIEIGDGGPKLRFRVYKSKPRPGKTMSEALADCIDCVQTHGNDPLSKARVFLKTATRELVAQTSHRFRWGILALILVVASTTALTYLNLGLQQDLEAERLRVDGLRVLLARTEDLTVDDMARLRSELDAGLTGTLERVTALEERAGAGRRVISTAAESVVFLQGAYGFLESQSRRLLRFVVGPDGRPVTDDQGNPGISPDGNGPPVESFWTGTGFVAGDGLIVTNRHVARPWEFDQAAQMILGEGYETRVTRFVGYFPGVEEPFAVELAAVSEEADVALLRCVGVTGRAHALALSETPVEAGDEVIVLGYPTGIRALLARTDEAFVGELMREGALDFWQVARRLAQAGRIAPLATRGIVGQVTTAAVVYDAETTSGGSGGPVLDLEGEVVALNTAVLPEFSGANQGVPVAAVRRLLEAQKPPAVRLAPSDEIPAPNP